MQENGLQGTLNIRKRATRNPECKKRTTQIPYKLISLFILTGYRKGINR